MYLQYENSNLAKKLDSWRASLGRGSTGRLIRREAPLVVERLETSSRQERKRAKLYLHLYLTGKKGPGGEA